MKKLFLLLILCAPLIGMSQVDRRLDRRNSNQRLGDGNSMNGNRNGNRNDFNDRPTVIDNREKPPIADYKIISVENDTTSVDTTLTIYKDYKFNYLREDDFELLPFSNTGQPYSHLGYDFHEVSLMPGFGARAKHFAFMEVDDIFYYNVPTPLTELFFKTTFEQGQNVDAFFTSNLTPRFNFSIAYKGLRSLGKYQHILARQGSFRFTANYQTKNNRYDLKTHFVAQDLSNEENGGLTPLSQQQFESTSGEFTDRGVLAVNFEDAENLLLAKRFFLKHHYKVIKGNDSTQNNQVRVGHMLNFTDKEYSYKQTTAFPGFGEPFENTNIRDLIEFQDVSNTLFANYRNKLLGTIGFKVKHDHFNYGYKSKLILEDGIIPNRLKGDVFAVGATYAKNIGGFDIKGDAMLNVAGDFSGSYIKGKAGYRLDKDNVVQAGINIDAHAPNYNFLLYQSDYVNYNWRNSYDNVQKRNLNISLKSKKIADIDADLTQITNYAYFGLRENDQLNADLYSADTLITPYQYSGNINYLKLKAHRNFKWRNFSLDNTLMYQNVFDGAEVFHVPDFATRNSLYYENFLFSKALFLQTGFTYKYFTSYEADGYDPVLAEFYVQDKEDLEGFSTVDFFLNAKIKQTRIFFKLENFTTLLEGNGNYSAPVQPYRDFAIRFGLVWNFFL